MHRTALTMSLILALVSAPAATAAMVTINPSKDNTLIETTSSASQLSNGQNDIFVGRTGQPAGTSIRRGLVHFDIEDAVPAGATITGVTLRMRDVMGNNGNRTTTLHVVQQDWGKGSSNFGGGVGAPAQEDDATWYYTFYDFANPGASPTWTTPGGDFNPTASASTVIVGGTPGVSFSWSSAQMVADVQNWLDNPTNNFGWLLRGDESVGMTAKRLNSGESAFPPALEITYVPEPATWLLLATGLVLVGLRRIVRR